MRYPIRTIVAGIADVQSVDPVLAPSVELAERTGAVLDLVHAFEVPPIMWDVRAGAGYVDREGVWEYCDDAQSRLQAQVGELGYAGPVRYRALAGPVADAIHDAAKREPADLIVVGATRRGALTRTLLGTTAQRVLRHAPAPVLVLRRALPERLGRVLLTTDLSPLSEGVHEAGLDVAEGLAPGEVSSVRSLLVVWPGMERAQPVHADALIATAREELTAFLRERQERPFEIAGVVRTGDPAREIVAEAASGGAELLIVGTHGRSGPERWLLGSVAESTVRNARGNVLVIPGRTAARWDDLAIAGKGGAACSL
ncbi:MAG TPA: universal stress protein [Longimicrobiaceae bacterium]|nr:universal stress protein [Longimicrobiaceae bacterium]